MEEPIPGWIDNIYGLIGFTVSGGIGILRVMYMNEYVCEDTHRHCHQNCASRNLKALIDQV